MRGWAALAVCLGLAACDAMPKSRLPDIRLKTVSARQADSLASCPTPKCLTVYVAPWCGYCRQATPMLAELKGQLQGRVSMRVIVGMDDLLTAGCEGQARSAARINPADIGDNNRSPNRVYRPRRRFTCCEPPDKREWKDSNLQPPAS